MTKKERYTFHQNGNNHTVIDEEENVPLIMIEFKEDEFPVYFCFHKIIDLLNEKEEQIQELEKDLNDALNRIEERSIDVQLLKEENRNLKKENEVKGDFRNFINEDIVRIKKENEQLKKAAREFAQNQTQHNLWRLRTILKDSDME